MKVADDGMSVRLVVDNLRQYYVHEINLPGIKSASGSSMSKYDVEVEARLRVLEAAVEELKGHSHQSSGGGGDVEAKLDDLITRLGRKMKF